MSRHRARLGVAALLAACCGVGGIVLLANTGDPAPAPTPAATPTRPPSSPAVASSRADPRFDSCEEAVRRGYGPYRRGVDPEYGWYQDRDDDGVVCE